MLKQAAVEGLGLSLIPTFIAAADLLAGRLVMVALETSPDTDVIAAVFPRAHGGIPRIRAFVDHLQTAFGDPPPWDRELVDAGLLTLD